MAPSKWENCTGNTVYFPALPSLVVYLLQKCKYFAFVNVAMAVLISLPFCLRLQNRPSRCFCFVWDAGGKKRQVPVCACVCVFLCACKQQRNVRQQTKIRTPMEAKPSSLSQTLYSCIQRGRRTQTEEGEAQAYTPKGLPFWSWICTHQHRVTCWVMRNSNQNQLWIFVGGLWGHMKGGRY